jgi:peptidoglycan/xylan/chitin deacetylase (PgdA/CDA1 family)
LDPTAGAWTWEHAAMRKPVKQTLLYLSRTLGLFALARRLTRRGLRIICFHGGSVGDEHRFRPGLFMRSETIRRRLQTLARHGYPVLDLSSALRALTAVRLPPCATVITIDDGFHSTYTQAAALLREFRLPATVYVTTYYVAKQTPIFRLVVHYLFWKTDATVLDGTGLQPLQPVPHDLTEPVLKMRLCWDLIHHGEAKLSEVGRVELSRELARRLGIDYEALVRSRAFHLMTTDEVRALADSGIDIQLHTHRHCLPPEPELAGREVVENRACLAGVSRQPLEHLCYPSGIWSQKHWPTLQALGIASATTCDAGLNYPDTPRCALRRFLDAENVSAIEFEAELSGFTELLRGIRARLSLARQSGRGKPLEPEHAEPPRGDVRAGVSAS